MPWTPDTVFVEGLDFFSASVGLLHDLDWSRPSPCSEWTALDVLGHVGTAVRFGTDLLSGGQPEWSPTDSPGDAVEGDPHSWWSALVAPARRAVASTDLTLMVDSPGGRRSVADGLSFPALDLFIHAWDLARSAGRDVEIPPEAIDFASVIFEPIPEDRMRSPRVFGESLAPPAKSSESESFVAWTGRDPRWAQPGD